MFEVRELSYKGPRVATPKTRSPAPLPVDRRPQARWITHRARTLVPACSVKSTPLSNPEGPRRGCAAGQHAQHFGPFIPRRLAYTMPHGNLGTSTGPCHHCGYPQQIVVPGSPVNSGAQPEGCGDNNSTNSIVDDC